MGCKVPEAGLGPASQSKGYDVPAGKITRQDKSLGLPGDLAAGTRRPSVSGGPTHLRDPAWGHLPRAVIPG